MQKKSELSLVARSLRPSLVLFQQNDPLRMAGATAFFTTFALPPIIFILVRLFGVFLDRRTVGRGLMQNLSNTIGEEGTGQVRQVIRGIRGFGDHWYIIVFGSLFLLFVATTLFTVIKNSLDQIWKIGLKQRPGIMVQLRIRLKSLGVILVAGVLFLADLLLESLQIVAGNYLHGIWQAGAVYFKGVFSVLVSVIVVSCWFVLLFRFLADGRPRWKAAVVGGILTGALFIVGRLLLRVLLLQSNISHMYGPAGSLVLVLLFVFYSSFIFYYGASFIAVYSKAKGWPITPYKKAYNYEIEASRP